MTAKDFELPKDTDKLIHLNSGISLKEIMDMAQHKWGENINFEDISVSSESIQVQCFGYDLYDSGDYMNFIILEIET